MQSHTNAVPFSPVLIGAIRMAHSMRWLSSGLSPGLSLVRQVLSVLRQRRQLATLSNKQLADIGITREQALIEAARPFWELPKQQGR
jgi:uncharacterized protein YjiS (DUF1127 family)